MFLFTLLLLFTAISQGESCQNDGTYCQALLSSRLIYTSTLDYKCKFPIYLLMPNILAKDPTTYMSMKVGQYCQTTCCSINNPAASTTASTTVPTTSKPQRSSLDRLNWYMDEQPDFKNLLNDINFNSTAAEGLKRFQKFNKTQNQVEVQNIQNQLGLSTFQMAVNKFAVELNDEIAPLSLSLNELKPSKFVAKKYEVVSKRKKRQDVLNDTVDWRPFMKPILDQGVCGGCWAFSIVAMIEGFFGIHGYDIPSLSVQQLIACDTSTDPTLGLANVGCNGGYFQIAEVYLKSKGERSTDEIPFDIQTISTCTTNLYAPIVPTLLTFDDGYVSATSNTTIIQQMELAIEAKVRKGPVSVGMAVSQDIYSYSSGVYDGNCGTSINHAVVIVGFTDDYWIIRNSWGVNWGEEGYIRVKRTSGQDPCKLYQYWSQALSTGSNETFAPITSFKKSEFKKKLKFLGAANPHFVNNNVTLTNSTSSCDCEEICDYCEEDDDDDDFYFSVESNSTSTVTSTPPTTTTIISTTITPKTFIISSWMDKVKKVLHF